jgi:uncharacterized membrane protein YfcA
MQPLTLHNSVLLFSSALAAGALNSVAGGGSFISFPALLLTGVPPIQANATNTMAVWPGTVASVGAYRREFENDNAGILIPLFVTGTIGGTIGALTLLRTPQATFLRLVPYLLAAATLLFAVSGSVTRWVNQRTITMRHRGPLSNLFGALVQLVIAIYIGFFGAGAGILMLALLAILGVENIHTMNAYKTLLATLCNGIAIVTFLFAGVILWPQAILMLVGAAIGGYFGAHYAQKMDPLHVRYIVIALGVSMSVYFFWTQGF